LALALTVPANPIANRGTTLLDGAYEAQQSAQPLHLVGEPPSGAVVVLAGEPTLDRDQPVTAKLDQRPHLGATQADCRYWK
jgi:hypothetical protein